MVCAELFEKIKDLSEIYLDVLEDVCNIESPTNYKEGVDKVGEYFIDMAIKHGWKVEVFEQEIAGNVVCITMNPDAENSPVSLSGHLDTVHPVGSFGTPAVKRDEHNMYGPGVMDCKGGAVAAWQWTPWISAVLKADLCSCCCKRMKKPVAQQVKRQLSIISAIKPKVLLHF